jgi:nicotinamidase-related amidase
VTERTYSQDEILALAHHAYRTGQATFPVVSSRCALLVIDMQDEFVKPGWTPYWVPEATRMAPRLGAYMPNRYHPPDSGVTWFRDGCIWYELAPQAADIVIYKPSYGAFYDTPLQTILQNLERDTIIITGALTNFCCGMTARQGYERGFQVVFASDLTATDDPELQEAELAVMRKGFARVMSAEDISAVLDKVMAP